MAIRVEIIGGPDRGRSAQFQAGDAFVVGRDVEHSGIVLDTRTVTFSVKDDRYLSRKHFELTAGTDGVITVRDLGSTGGTFVDDQPIGGPTPLGSGQQIRAGATRFTAAPLDVTLPEGTGTAGKSTSVRPGVPPRLPDRGGSVVESEPVGNTSLLPIHREGGAVDPPPVSPEPSANPSAVASAEAGVTADAQPDDLEYPAEGWLPDVSAADLVAPESHDFGATAAKLVAEDTDGAIASGFDLFTALRERGEADAAVKLVPSLLTRVKAVWWACHCCRLSGEIEPLSDSDQTALVAAESWVRDPRESLRRSAAAYAERIAGKTCGGWAARAVEWSMGSLSGPDAPPIPPNPEMCAAAARTAVTLAAARVGFKGALAPEALCEAAVQLAAASRPWGDETA